MKYNKLVRDNIPEIIKEEGSYPTTHIADQGEYWEKLKEKLLEEVNEYIKTENPEELGDIFEVIYAIIEFKGIDLIKLERGRKKKGLKKGKFIERIILGEVVKVKE